MAAQESDGRPRHWSIESFLPGVPSWRPCVVFGSARCSPLSDDCEQVRARTMTRTFRLQNGCLGPRQIDFGFLGLLHLQPPQGPETPEWI